MDVGAPIAEGEAQSATALAKQFPIPAGVFVALDERHRQWTDVQGAMVMAGKSRRTIFNWIKHGWVTIRRLPNGKPQILVASLWSEETPGEINGR